MKVCAIGLRGIPNVMGGIESHCQQLYPRLVTQGMEVTILARSPYVQKGEYEFKGVKVIPVWAMRHKFLETFLHTFVAIFYARLFVHPNVIHLHAIGPALFTPLARLLGMKVVMTHHGADYDRQKWNAFAKGLLKAGEWMAINFGNKVLVVGKSLTDRLQQENPKQAHKIAFVPNGAPADFDTNVTLNDLQATGLAITEQSYIVTVGRLVPEKGFHDLVQAYLKADIQQKLVVVGSTDHQDEYSRDLLSKSSDRVIFAGLRKGAQLKALYKFAKLFVLPSYHEGLPIAALEAISADTPVLLSDIIPNLDIDLCADNYFSLGNLNELAQKIQLPIPRCPRDAILAKFNWEKIAEQTASLFKETILK
ncbi:MAG: glycosyl transferase [Alteromonadaceae bacterium]|uniref:glycosyltransferase family 4 protein n=1 Tax=Paraglaciecola chathamensis TaxID=368405 RepID=UPI000C63AC33|nr:glycosyltransferase family 4 protein [Paraglaciecola agarilytica]MBN24186.1 glycosyl transferase [Alteromonadaceae bacterium]|tara:strand:- start:16609 stop:17703 length:1095 start_codon:yes stop_codon:yes gene_type:complete